MSAFGSATSSMRSQFLSVRATRLKKAVLKKASRLSQIEDEKQSSAKENAPPLPIAA